MVDDILKGMKRLEHDTFLVQTGDKTIYFDPFKLPGDPVPADLILISHEHYDHCSPEDVARVQRQETVIVTERQSAAKLSGRVKTLAPGETCEAAGIRVEAVPAYNTNKQFHPQANRWLGFIVTVGGVRIYHAGDTDFIPEMRDLKADIALLPVSGTYVMTAEEAVEAALVIRPAVAVPMHYGSIVGSNNDAERFAAGLKGRIRVEMLA